MTVVLKNAEDKTECVEIDTFIKFDDIQTIKLDHIKDCDKITLVSVQTNSNRFKLLLKDPLMVDIFYKSPERKGIMTFKRLPRTKVDELRWSVIKSNQVFDLPVYVYDGNPTDKTYITLPEDFK